MQNLQREEVLVDVVIRTAEAPFLAWLIDGR
jgi:hypothetical protein